MAPTNPTAALDLLATEASAHAMPLSIRLDAVDLLSCAVESRGALDYETMVRLLDGLVPAFLRLDSSGDEEELGDELFGLLESVICASPPCSESTAALLKQAEEYLAANECTPIFAVHSLLGLAFDVEAPLAALTLPSCRHLIGDLIKGMESTGSGAELAPRTALAACNSVRIFLKLLEAHTEQPSTVLGLCELSLLRMLSLLPGVSSRVARPPPSLELLELLTEMAKDATLAPAMATPAVLIALKPPLLSGQTPLQLACIDLLATLHDCGGAEARTSLCSEDVTAFLIELCRREARRHTMSAAHESACELRRNVRALLAAMLRHPHHSSGLICSRLIEALCSGSGAAGAGGAGGLPAPAPSALPPGHGRAQSLPTTTYSPAAAITSAASAAAAEEQDYESLLLEVQAVCNLLRWHAPIAPRETSRLAKYCEGTLPVLLLAAASAHASSLWDDAAAVAPSPEEDDQVAAAREAARKAAALAIEAKQVAAALVHAAVTGCAKSTDANALKVLLQLLADDQIFEPLLADHGQLLGGGGQPAQLERDVANALAMLLGGDHALPAKLRRAFAYCLAPSALDFVGRLGACTEQSELAGCLLTALGRLPAGTTGRSSSHHAFDLPAHIGACIQGLRQAAAVDHGGGGRGVCAGGGCVLHKPPLAQIEWLLLHLQHERDVHTCLAALDAFVTGQAPRLPWLLPAPTLRRLATIWAQQQQPARRSHLPTHSMHPDAMETDELEPALPLEAPTSCAAAYALAAALAQLPADQSISLPPHVLRWLWRQLDALDSEAATALLVRWAVAVPAWSAPGQCHASDGGSADASLCEHGGAAPGGLASADGASGGGGGIAPSTVSGLLEACRGDAHAAQLLTRLLSTQLHQAQAASGGLCAILGLVQECLVDVEPASTLTRESKSGEGGPSTAEPSHAAFAEAGLAAALAHLCMLLPVATEGAPSAALRLVIRLLTTQMRFTAGHASCSVDASASLHEAEVGRLLGLGGANSADTHAATHHAVTALLRDAKASGANGAGDGARGETRLEMLNFLNVVVALHAETVDTIASNPAVVETLAHLAAVGMAVEQTSTSPPPTADTAAAAASDGQCAAAACLLLTQLLRCLAADSPAAELPAASLGPRGGSSSSMRRTLVEMLCIHLGDLGRLLPAVQSPLAIRCSAALHLMADLIDTGVLFAAVTSPSPPPPSPTTIATQLDPSAPSQVLLQPPAADVWTSGLMCALLNLAVRREACALSGLHRLCASLVASDSAGVRAAFRRVAEHPWQLFLLEVAVKQRRLQTPLCGYFTLVLEARPAWTHLAALRKPELFRKMANLLLHAKPFGAEELALLSALHAIAALSPPLVAEAQRLLAYRVREPSAARWGVADDVDDDALGSSSGLAADRFVTLDGVVAPAVVLRAALPTMTRSAGGVATRGGGAGGVLLLSQTRPTPASVGYRLGPTGADEMEMLRQAERMLIQPGERRGGGHVAASGRLEAAFLR